MLPKVTVHSVWKQALRSASRKMSALTVTTSPEPSASAKSDRPSPGGAVPQVVQLREAGTSSGACASLSLAATTGWFRVWAVTCPWKLSPAGAIRSVSHSVLGWSSSEATQFNQFRSTFEMTKENNVKIYRVMAYSILSFLEHLLQSSDTVLYELRKRLWRIT